MAVTLHTTHGPLKFELFCSAAPKTTYNFLALCATSAYNNSPFHRLIPNFMIQGGSPSLESLQATNPAITTKEAIKESPSIYGSPFEDEVNTSTLKHNARGIVSMANKGPNTNGSQFFVTFDKAAHLDGKNTVFGRVIEGWDTLDKMEALAVDKKNRPKDKVMIERVTIHANPLADEQR